MDSIFLDGRVSIQRVDFPQIVQLTAWKGQEANLSKWIAGKTGLNLPAPARATNGDELSLLSTGPNRWQCVGEGALNALTDFDQDLGTVLDLSSARSLFKLRGDNLAWLLNKGTAVNLDNDMCPDGSVIMTTIDHVGVTINKIAQDAYDLYVFSSFGETMEHWLSEASNDLEFES